MSHLSEIIENHKNLDDLFAIIKHYGVSAEFVTDALVQRFEQIQKDEDGEDKNTEEESAYCAEIIDSLSQYYARL
ncbi:hypothetical protein N0M98_16680 [Paenibacillus doosanensis]|uniref:Uncharacterized protein n=1 Tax=Paenibacillus konkukensis TaxID=2020716 RepID=A0ABY4RML0_9BACL|nr:MULTISPECIES: hypothetical protein [Paenibacillus]MCS7461792.1 hypothetical protein [Paenibacillus doosanensis]UQZ83631.1 hypothetical protein SK3146_02818 [Paenibacillus konkukensis]